MVNHIKAMSTLLNKIQRLNLYRCTSLYLNSGAKLSVNIKHALYVQTKSHQPAKDPKHVGLVFDIDGVLIKGKTVLQSAVT